MQPNSAQKATQPKHLRFKPARDDSGAKIDFGSDDQDKPVLRMLIGILKKGNFQFVDYKEVKGHIQSMDLNLVQGEYVILLEVQKSMNLNAQTASLLIQGEHETQLTIFEPKIMQFSQSISKEKHYAFARYMIFKNYLVKQIKNSQKIDEIQVSGQKFNVLLYKLYSLDFYILPNGNKQAAVKLYAHIHKGQTQGLRILGQESILMDSLTQELKEKPMNF